MNSRVQVTNDTNTFVVTDRTRLLSERNKYKMKAEGLEVELSEVQESSRRVISILLVIAMTLIGALAYVLSNS